MGFVGGMLGVSGGQNGTGYAGASSANVLSPATVKQADEQYANVNNGLTQQQNFVNALQAQNGIGNQSNVFNQLQGVANGTGPNPAQAMLANSTGANVANQAALMASQRGSSANPGMIARQAAQAGGNLQQQAAGQGAALQAQQSVNALNSMGSMAGQMVNNQANANNAYSQSAQGAQSNILNSIGNQNNANVGMQSNVNNANQSGANAVMGGQQQLMGNIMSGAGGAMMLAQGGAVQQPAMMASGGVTPIPMIGADLMMPMAPSQAWQPQGGGPQWGKQMGDAIAGAGTATNRSNAQTLGDYAKADQMLGSAASNPSTMMDASQNLMPFMAAEGGKVDALVSPGEKYLDPSDVKKVEQGANPMQVGEKIPGKPKVGGAKNDYANDTVSKKLDEGGIVLPRSVTQAKHPAWAAHAFVSQIMAKQGKSLPKKGMK